jgi:hypothetical protein
MRLKDYGYITTILIPESLQTRILLTESGKLSATEVLKKHPTALLYRYWKHGSRIGEVLKTDQYILQESVARI